MVETVPFRIIEHILIYIYIYIYILFGPFQALPTETWVVDVLQFRTLEIYIYIYTYLIILCSDPCQDPDIANGANG